MRRFFPKFSSKCSVILWISFIPQFPLKRNRPENSIFIAFDKVSSEVLLSLSPGCPESLLGDTTTIKKWPFDSTSQTPITHAPIFVFWNILRWWSVSALVFVSHSRVSLISPYSHVKKKPRSNKPCRDGSRIFFSRGCTRIFALLQHQ